MGEPWRSPSQQRNQPGKWEPLARLVGQPQLFARHA